MLHFLQRCLDPVAVLMLFVVIWGVSSVLPLPRWLFVALIAFIIVLAFIAWLFLVGG